MAYQPRSGGGKVGEETTDVIVLDKPYDLAGDPDQAIVQQIDEMLGQLYDALKRTHDSIVSGTGDVVGPASAATNHVATFNGITGKLIKDGGSSISDIISSVLSMITVGAIGGVNGTLKTATLLLSDADIKGLSATPILIVPAPGVGYVNIPLLLVGKANIAGGYNTSQILSPVYNGDTVNVYTGTVMVTTTTGVSYHMAPNTGNYNSTASFDPENKAIYVKHGGVLTSGNGANTLGLWMLFVTIPAIAT